MEGRFWQHHRQQCQRQLPALFLLKSVSQLWSKQNAKNGKFQKYTVPKFYSCLSFWVLWHLPYVSQSVCEIFLWPCGPCCRPNLPVTRCVVTVSDVRSLGENLWPWASTHCDMSQGEWLGLARIKCVCLCPWAGRTGFKAENSCCSQKQSPVPANQKSADSSCLT